MRNIGTWLALALLWAQPADAQTVIATLVGRGGTGGCPTFDAPPGGGSFFVDPWRAPAGVAVDQNGKLFVSTSANCVFRLDADGLLRLGFLDSVPFRIGTGTGGFSDASPSFDAAVALISNPMNLAIDSAGNLYIADANNQRIRKVDTTRWTISTVAGGGSLRPNDGIRATDASFLFPTGVAVDPTGNIYVSDSNAAKVFKVDTNGILTRFAGSGAFTYNGEGIPATSAAMIPMGLAADRSGNVFIADWSNSIVRKVDDAGIITTVAGNPFNVTGLGDGGPAAFGGILARPRGVAVDSIGNLFVADTEHHRIRKVDQGGIINTVAGNGTPGATDVQLNFPYAVAADDLGNIFIADTGNNEIRGVIVTERTYQLTLGSAGTGSGALAGGGSYVIGQVVPVSATAASGSTFVSWSGPNAAECASGTVLMDADKSCTANFDSVADTTPPVLSGVPASFTFNTTSASGAVVLYKLPTATDPDDAAGPVTCAPPSGSLFPVGVTTVTCSSADTHGNRGTASFTVTVVAVTSFVPIFVTETISVSDTVTVTHNVLVFVQEQISVTDSDSVVVPDTTPPVVIVPASLTVQATGPNGAVVTFPLPKATDPDDAAGPVTCAPASGSTFALGTTKMLCQSTDTHGNLGTAAFTVSVVDTTPPVLTLPATIVVDATSPAGAVVSYTASALDDVNGSVAVNCTPTSGSTFPIGTTAVRCSAGDAAGNFAFGSFNVTVLGASEMLTAAINTSLADQFSQAVNLLQNASRSVGRGNVAPVCGQMTAFVNQVNAQTGGKLTADQASVLLALAADIKATLGCQ